MVPLTPGRGPGHGHPGGEPEHLQAGCQRPTVTVTPVTVTVPPRPPSQRERATCPLRRSRSVHPASHSLGEGDLGPVGFSGRI